VGKVRNLIIVFGDQLDAASAALDDFDASCDVVLMMEGDHEATYIPQHKIRLVLFFSAMRHFREALERNGVPVVYVRLDDRENSGRFDSEIARAAGRVKPERLVAMQPGDHRVLATLRSTADDLGIELELRADRHFLCSDELFAEFVGDRDTLVMERFYRMMRRETGYLMDADKPVGGQWNYDADNRQPLKASDADDVPEPLGFAPDEITEEVIRLVETRYPDSPGRLERFDYPVTADQARDALDDFVANRLGRFGTYQDAMVTGQPYLYHARLSSSLNLHLLDPRTAIEAAVAALVEGAAPLNAVEGFVRQILGWREYVRGVYWLRMPDYAELNVLDADLPMPGFMWTGETEMNCIAQCVSSLRDHAYAHHIQRLMVLGLFAMLLGVRPYDVHRWHMSMYADAIDWVSLPNVLGMSQYGDGGIVGTKPYCASGNYISRMSDYCSGCRYDPKQASGSGACPMTTLYWDFLARNRDRLKSNHRMGFQFKNLDRKSAEDRHAIADAAAALKAEMTQTQ